MAVSALPRLPKAYYGLSVWLLYAVGLLPAAWSFYLGASDQLGADPVKTFELTLGIWALRFLVATLAITPLRDLTPINWLRYRRALGLLAFYYVAMHFSVYVLLDQALDVNAIVEDVLKRPFIMLGMAGLVLLIPLAATSNSWSIRRLGSRWSSLHKLSYVVILSGALHFVLARKNLTLEPAFYLVLTVLLLEYRFLRKPIVKWKRSLAQPVPIRR